MSSTAIPLGDVAISIRSISCSPALVIEGIDLDSGHTAQVQIVDETLRTLAEQLRSDPASLVLVLSLYAMTSPHLG